MLTPEQVSRVAHLARLTLTDDERQRYARQLSAILDYAEQLASVDVSHVPPTATVLPVRSVVRHTDEAHALLTRDEVLKNAPRSDGESFEVAAAITES
ncbi:MAG: Asp-tRNA(Asn)/Glu-tRNA(Gln) amidotransferase subunit GatC [Anaerolineae bacterium]|nr:Asp-tRNA(Asn)/Glu-tRNA(Gln) amidotransferase subunit GatC [Anaerolineae bacterium]